MTNLRAYSQELAYLEALAERLVIANGYEPAIFDEEESMFDDEFVELRIAIGDLIDEYWGADVSGILIGHSFETSYGSAVVDYSDHGDGDDHSLIVFGYDENDELIGQKPLWFGFVYESLTGYGTSILYSYVETWDSLTGIECAFGADFRAAAEAAFYGSPAIRPVSRQGRRN